MPFADHRADLDRLSRIDRRRVLLPTAGHDFASNDYLGLAGSDALRDVAADALARGVAVGSGGSRLLRGNDAEIEALEEDTARWFGCEAALFFGSGFAANAALLATLPQRGDRVFHDALIHASAHDGMRLSRAEAEAVPHNDPQAMDDAVRRWRAGGGTGTAWIAVESLYSMDGDRAPVGDYHAVARAHGGVLLVDEAHATGVFGAGGRGMAHGLQGMPDVVTLHTCGKALGCEGALVCGPAVVRDFLVNRARGFVFSTAPSPLVAACVRGSLRLVEAADDRRAALAALARHAAATLAPHGAADTGTQILPVVLGDNGRTMRVADRLRRAGFDVRGIRPPTVAAGTARLRVSVTLNVGHDAVTALGEAMREALAGAA